MEIGDGQVVSCVSELGSQSEILLFVSKNDGNVVSYGKRLKNTANLAHWSALGIANPKTLDEMKKE
jgi:hypothetical protein